MNKIALSKYQIHELVWANRQLIDEKIEFISQYLNRQYEIDLITFTGDNYGFDINKNKMQQIITKVIKEEKSKYRALANINKEFSGAVIIVNGNYNIAPQYQLDEYEQSIQVNVFVYQQTFIDKRHQILAKQLFEEKAVKLYPGCDKESLYQALSESAETLLFDNLKKIATGLPIYQVKFDEDGSFDIEERGQI